MAGLVAVAFTGCDSTTGPDGDGSRVSVRFRSAGGAATATAPSAAGRLAGNRGARAVTLTGSNGTLALDEIWMIVAEFELERANDDDCDSSGPGNDCEKFQAPPQFIQLPLDGVSAPVVSQEVPPDLYDELEFEVEDIELDEDENAAEVQALFDQIRALFPDWPEKASMLVTGSFTPTGGAARTFRVFFEAEIEIEIELEPPLDLRDGSDASVTVVVDPALWFARPDGTVLDLSQFQGQLVEFEAEFENGFTEIEFDDD